jgi:hypothetical protein
LWRGKRGKFLGEGGDDSIYIWVTGPISPQPTPSTTIFIADIHSLSDQLAQHGVVIVRKAEVIAIILGFKKSRFSAWALFDFRRSFLIGLGIIRFWERLIPQLNTSRLSRRDV